jgi:hypothetical protein
MNHEFKPKNALLFFLIRWYAAAKKLIVTNIITLCSTT